MNNTELIQYLNKDMALELPEKISFAELEEKLSAGINQLIQNNFEKLVSLLYRIDVSEKKLKNLLQGHANENAGKIIAQLIIERQLEKMALRKKYKKENTGASDEETW
jgi:replicative superfamily II helicase